MADPIALLRADRAAAHAASDPNANVCVLATVADGEPQARVLVLREVDARLGVFFNGSSPKRCQLGQSETVAVVVYLPSRAVQYRLTCRLEAIPSTTVRASWGLRPAIPKRLDWLYERHPQGSAVSSRTQLVQLLAEPSPDTAPATALGYYLVTNAVDRLHLDQPDGIHDRRLFTLVDDVWREEVLVP